ncbi:MAG: hypothetical protein IPL01_15360 [Acidobacteria bacterium]|nr:hypothetical protein [Acidobacteriota bacterium]
MSFENLRSVYEIGPEAVNGYQNYVRACFPETGFLLIDVLMSGKRRKPEREAADQQKSRARPDKS